MNGRGELPCWAALSIIAGLIFGAIFVWQFPSNSAEWAAWVQAFGSVTAVGSGVLLIRHQIKSRKELEVEKENQNRIRLIKNLKTEIKVNWERLESSWGHLLGEDESDAEGVSLIMNARGWPFPVYDSSASQLGMIESEDVRDLFISAYAAARAFLLTMEINNELFFRYERASLDVQHARATTPALLEAAQLREQAAIQHFHQYGSHVRARYGELRALVAAVLEIDAI